MCLWRSLLICLRSYIYKYDCRVLNLSLLDMTVFSILPIDSTRLDSFIFYNHSFVYIICTAPLPHMSHCTSIAQQTLPRDTFLCLDV